MLVIHGVPKGMPGTSRGVKAGFLVVFFLVWLGPQALVLFVLPRLGGYAALWMLAGAVIAIGFFVYSTRKHAAGSMRFTLSALGLAMEPLAKKPRTPDGVTDVGRVYFPWHGDEVYRVRRVGTFWRRLDVRRRGEPKFRVELGFRGPDFCQQIMEDGFAMAFPRPDASTTPPTTPVPAASKEWR